MMVSLDGFFEGPNHELDFGERVADLTKDEGRIEVSSRHARKRPATNRPSHESLFTWKAKRLKIEPG